MYHCDLPKTAKLINGSDRDYIDVDGSVYGTIMCGNNKGKHYKKKLQNCYGYKYCGIRYKNTKQNKSTRVHRLVAIAFIPNPNNFDIVGHRNNIKSDNRVENLYWTTTKENTQKAYDDKLVVNNKSWNDSQSMPVVHFETSTNKILGVYGSINEAERMTGIYKKTISNQAKYKRPVRKQTYFRFLDDESVTSLPQDVLKNFIDISKCESTIETYKGVE